MYLFCLLLNGAFTNPNQSPPTIVHSFMSLIYPQKWRTRWQVGEQESGWMGIGKENKDIQELLGSCQSCHECENYYVIAFSIISVQK